MFNGQAFKYNEHLRRLRETYARSCLSLEKTNSVWHSVAEAISANASRSLGVDGTATCQKLKKKSTPLYVCCPVCVVELWTRQPKNRWWAWRFTYYKARKMRAEVRAWDTSVQFFSNRNLSPYIAALKPILISYLPHWSLASECEWNTWWLQQKECTSAIGQTNPSPFNVLSLPPRRRLSFCALFTFARFRHL